MERGGQCRKFCSIYSELPIDLVVDNDRSKTGTKIYGHSVKHFDEIADWNERFIIITCYAYKDISEQLQGVGMRENTDFIVFFDAE